MKIRLEQLHERVVLPWHAVSCHRCCEHNAKKKATVCLRAVSTSIVRRNRTMWLHEVCRFSPPLEQSRVRNTYVTQLTRPLFQSGHPHARLLRPLCPSGHPHARPDLIPMVRTPLFIKNDPKLWRIPPNPPNNDLRRGSASFHISCSKRLRLLPAAAAACCL